MSDISALTDLMETHMIAIKSTMSDEQKAVVDAMILIERVRLYPDRYTISQLRGSAMRYIHRGQPLLATYMDLLADKIEIERQTKTYLYERSLDNENKCHSTLS